MPTEDNKTVVLAYFEKLWNKRDTSIVDEIIAPDVVAYPSGKRFQGADLIPRRVEMMHEAFSNLHFHLEDLLADGEKVVIRWTMHGTNTGEYMGRAPTNNAVTVTGMSIFRLANGKIAEFWEVHSQVELDETSPATA